MDLCTTDQAKEQCKKDGTDQDTLFATLIDRASLMIETYCNRKFKLQTYTEELYSGTGTPFLYMRNHPIDANTTPTVKYRIGASTWQTQVVTYLRHEDADEQGLLFWEDSSVWPRGTYNMQITYKAGFATTPSNLPQTIIQAAVELVQVLYERRQNMIHLQPAVTVVDGITAQYKDAPMPMSVRYLLDPYKVRSV
jgi:hypothetical protein